MLGIEGSQEILEWCDGNLSPFKLNAQVYLQQVASLSEIGARNIDVLLLTDVLLHIPKSAAAFFLTGLKELLASGGVAYLNVPSINDDSLYQVRMCHRQIEPDVYEVCCNCSGDERMEPLSYYRPLELEMLLTSLGLRVTRFAEFSDSEGLPLKFNVLVSR